MNGLTLRGIALFGGLTLAAAVAGQETEDPPREGVEGSGEPTPPAAAPAATTLVFEVPVEGRHVSARALVAGLLDGYGIGEGETIHQGSAAGGAEDVRIRVGGRRGVLVLTGAQLALGGTVKFALREGENEVGAEGPRERWLVVTVDRRRVRELRGRAKSRLARWAGRLWGEDLESRSYRVDLPVPAEQGAALVLLLHGVDSNADRMGELRAHLEAAGFSTGTFAYPNDEAIDRSARRLGEELARYGEKHPQRRVRIVAHSMGGLVARFCLETPGLDPGNVDLLVLLGTPNGGSYLALGRSLLDAGMALSGHLRKEALVEVLTDGLGEAGWDLRPGSTFLGALGARPRNPRVTYRLALGDRAPLPATQAETLSRQALDRLASSHLPAPLVRWFERALGDLEEIVEGKGDGAVAIKRGRLEGVEAVVLPCDHQSLISEHGFLGRPAPRDEHGRHPAFAQVEAWLREAARPEVEP